MAEVRAFKDVFSDIEVNAKLSGLLDTVFVERVIYNRQKKILRVYLVSDNWIRKQYIYDIEKAISDQVLLECGLDVKIIERFRLSRQYVPEKFYELYKTSMMLELKKNSPLLHELMRETTLVFPDPENIVAQMPDNVISRGRGSELEEFLEKVFAERAGFNVELRTELKESKGRNAFADDEEFIHNRVREVVRANRARKEHTKEETKLNAPQEKRFRSRQAFIARDPDVIYGRSLEGTPIPIAQVPDEPGEAVIRGEVFSVEEKETKSGKTIFTIALTDHTDSLRMKLFSEADDVEQFRATFKKGAAFLVKGMVAFDPFDREVMMRNVYAIKRSAPLRSSRTDDAKEKRIELHCHTKMSDMDAVSSATDIIRQAYEWGHKALAITDHGVVQAFPEALHTFGDKKGIPADADFKVIYGMEAYLVDDAKNLVHGATGEFLTDP
ncbi:MAG: PHP domain-containing protein, partial [Lachnospiraceae bacterium]|nr:PHP domain-containing protein [Lachnospiraceae bacterium]